MNTVRGFDYQRTPDGRVRVLWNGKNVFELSGNQAEKIAGRLKEFESELQASLQSRTGKSKSSKKRPSSSRSR